jgi:hypothetical protein
MSLGNRTLSLSALVAGIPAITRAVGETLIEACTVRFEDQGHRSGVELKVLGTFKGVYNIIWDGQVTDEMRLCWQDEGFTTEQAACGIAILLMLEHTGYTAIQRVDKASGIGFDYWLGHYDKNAIVPLKYMARLEVSGIRHGSDRRIQERIAEKRKQTAPSNGLYPAYIVVVEFGTPLAWVVRK